MIKSFPEFSLTKSNIPGNAFESSSLEFLVSMAARISYHAFYNCKIKVFFSLSKNCWIEDQSFTNCNFDLFEKNHTTTTNNFVYFRAYYRYFVSRCATENPLTLYGDESFGKIFVPNESVEHYKSLNGWSKFASIIFAIGNSEWQTAMRTLADKYANEYAGWTPEQIDTADYSDPYIDYRIFGLEPPTE